MQYKDISQSTHTQAYCNHFKLNNKTSLNGYIFYKNISLCFLFWHSLLQFLLKHANSVHFGHFFCETLFRLFSTKSVKMKLATLLLDARAAPAPVVNALILINICTPKKNTRLRSELGMARYHNFGFGTVPEPNTSVSILHRYHRWQITSLKI